MALSFLYRLLRRILELVRVHHLGDVAKDAEILVLRHQLAVLRRQVARPRFSWSDRALIALLASVVSRERWRPFLVTPQTVLDWHRRLVRRRWTYTHRRPGRPPLPDETAELICRLARENPRWAYLRIVGELKKLGVAVSKASVATVLRQHGLPPAPRRTGPSWSEFLHAQAQLVLAVLDRQRHGWRGMTMTPRATRRLQDLRRQLFADQSETDLGETVTAAA